LKRVILAAAGAAVVGIAACSHPAALTAGSGSHGSSSGQSNGVSVVASCSQRYLTWANPTGNALLATFHTLSVAVATGDSQAVSAALAKAKPAVTRASVHPVPACADPRGYWSVLLMHMNAAVSGKPSASGIHAALKDVPVIERELTTELESTSPAN
jgi:hypothetical protein